MVAWLPERLPPVVSILPQSTSPASPRGSDSRPAVVSDLARLQMLSRVAAQVGEGVVVSNNDGIFLYVNPEFASQHAATEEELTGAHLSSFYRKEDLGAVQQIIGAALEKGIGRGEVTRLRRDGTVFPARITLSLLRDDAGTLIGRVLCVHDISEQRKLEEELRQAALYDPLTQLPNRRLLRDRIDHALAMRERRQTGVAALFVDLDGFKRVNDTFGHDVGDEVLMEVSRRLTERVRQYDTLARLGGDEFVMLVEDFADWEQVNTIGQRVLSAFDIPVSTIAGNIPVSASIGIHVATDDDDYDSLLQAADHAMYGAKRAGRGGYQFSATKPARARRAT